MGGHTDWIATVEPATGAKIHLQRCGAARRDAERCDAVSKQASPLGGVGEVGEVGEVERGSQGSVSRRVGAPESRQK